MWCGGLWEFTAHHLFPIGTVCGVTQDGWMVQMQLDVASTLKVRGVFSQPGPGCQDGVIISFQIWSGPSFLSYHITSSLT